MGKTSVFNLKHDLTFKHEIKKDDYLKLSPTSSTADNINQSGNLHFEIAQSSSCLDICEAVLYFTVELKDIDVDEDITLENNFFPKLFSQMRLNLGGTDVEVINNPGCFKSHELCTS